MWRHVGGRRPLRGPPALGRWGGRPVIVPKLTGLARVKLRLTSMPFVNPCLLVMIAQVVLDKIENGI